MSNFDRVTFGRASRVALMCGVVVFVVVVALLDPQNTAFFPRCPFLTVTGYECPGCGSQRALHQLLHGNVVAAFGYNPLLVASLPYLVVGVVLEWWVRRRPTQGVLLWRRRLYGRWAIVVVAVLVIAFWTLRNVADMPGF